MTDVPPYIGEFADDDIAWVMTHGYRRRVRAGEAIITEGASPPELFVILEGSFLVSSRAMGKPDLTHLGPGELAGEMSYVHGSPPRATVRAEVDSTVWCIPRQELDAKIAADKGFASRFRDVVLKFVLDRTYESWGHREPEPLSDDVNARVRALIEKMLRGEFP